MKTKLLVLTLAGLFAAGGVQAQAAGSFMVRLGATQITPEVDSADLTAPSLAGTKIDVRKASQFSGAVTYFWTDNIAIDFPVGPAYKHRVVGAGAIAGVGTLGTVKSLPITVTAQYRFGEAASRFRPYVGGGVTYADLFKPRATATLSGITGGLPATPTLLSLKSTGGPVVQIGAALSLWRGIGVDVVVNKAFLKTTGRLSTGQTVEAQLDPVAVSVALSYTF